MVGVIEACPAQRNNVASGHPWVENEFIDHCQNDNIGIVHRNRCIRPFLIEHFFDVVKVEFATRRMIDNRRNTPRDIGPIRIDQFWRREK